MFMLFTGFMVLPSMYIFMLFTKTASLYFTHSYVVNIFFTGTCVCACARRSCARARVCVCVCVCVCVREREREREREKIR